MTRTTSRAATLLLMVGTFFGFFFSSFLHLSIAADGQSKSILGISHNSPGGIGWSNIHVFTGGNSSNLVKSSNIPQDYFDRSEWFSQVRQDEIVAHLLRHKRNGYFVDLAANDPIRISNTFALERNLKWGGLCIEANPIYWHGLSHRNCQVVGAVVGKVVGDTVDFRFPKEKAPKGGIVGSDFDNHNARHGELETRSTTTLAEILARFQAPPIIDYVSLDVEGAEFFVMSSFPFETYTIRVLTVERPSKELESLLRQHGYITLKKLKPWGEMLWIHRSFRDSVDLTALNIDSENYKYRESHSNHSPS